MAVVIYSGPPVFGPPIVQNRTISRVSRPIVNATFENLRIVSLDFNRSPHRILFVRRRWSPNVSRETNVGCAVVLETFLCFQQRQLIRPTCHRDEPQLRYIILPETDGAYFVASRQLLEDKVSAARARIGHGSTQSEQQDINRRNVVKTLHIFMAGRAGVNPEGFHSANEATPRLRVEGEVNDAGHRKPRYANSGSITLPPLAIFIGRPLLLVKVVFNEMPSARHTVAIRS